MKVLLLIIIVGIFIFFVFNNSKSNKYLCERCEGNGYWRGLRGERNHCKACDGTGSIENETS
jgi:DnaJ-class molecular chaperone